MNIYVASLSFKTTDEDLLELFEEFGKVTSARVITDKFTQKSRGFGFVEMENEAEGHQAIESLNGAEFMGRNLVVNEAKPRTENGGGGSFNRRPDRGGYNNNRRSDRSY